MHELHVSVSVSDVMKLFVLFACEVTKYWQKLIKHHRHWSNLVHS